MNAGVTLGNAARGCRQAVLGALVAWLALLGTARAEQITIPDQDTPVVDAAGVLDAATNEKLVGWLHDLKSKTGAQVKILTVPSLGDEDIFDLAQRHYQSWKLGTKGKDNGALIVLAPRDRKVRIHVGYGLEGALPDSWCGTLSRRVAQQYFSKQQYAAGLSELTAAVAARVAEDAKVEIDNLPPPKAEPDYSDLIFFLVLAFFLAIFCLSIYQQRQDRKQGKRWGGGSRGWGWSVLGPGDWPSGGGGWGSSSGGGGGWSGGGSDFGGGGSSGGGGGGASW